MSNINRVVISGRLTRDSEIRQTASGLAVLDFSLAVNDRRKNAYGTWEDYANYVDCTMFGNRAEALYQILKKGSLICVEGKLRWSSWEAKDGSKRSKLEVIVDEVELMQAKPQQPQAQEPEFADDDIPF